MQKKDIWILILLVLLPTLVLLFSCITSSQYFLWGYKCSNSYVYAYNIFALVGLLWVIKKRIINFRLSVWTLFIIYVIHLILFFILSSFKIF